MTFGGVDRDVHGVDVCRFEVSNELGLFFGVEAEVGIDGEDEELLPRLLAALEEFLRGFGITLDDGIVAGPHVDNTEVGVGVETLGELLSLMKHVALEGVADLEPGEHFFFFDELLASAALEGVEVDEGFVRDHAGQGEADAGIFAFVVIATVEVFVVLDSEDLLKENETIKDGCFKSGGNGDDAGHAFGMTGCEGQGEEATDGRTDGRMELLDAEVIEKGDLNVDKVGCIQVGEAGAEGFASFGIDAGRAGRAVTAAKVVGTDHKEAISINRFAGSDHFIPPAIVEFLSPKVTALGRLGMLSGEVVRS